MPPSPSPPPSPEWHAIRPWAPSLCLAVREITSVSATFILSSTVSDRENDPSLASRGLIAAAEDSDGQEDEPVASSSAISSISSPLCLNEEPKTRAFIAHALAKGLSVTVNGSPWPRVFIRVDEQSDEAVIIIYALMPGRQYDVELALTPSGQSTDNNASHLNSQITTEDDSDNAPSDSQTDPESPSLDYSTPSDHHSTPSTSPNRTTPGTPATVPQMTLEEKLNHLQQNLTAVNEERETLLASLKALRKDSQKADAALRSEIDVLKRSSEKHVLAESRGRQKVLALQEATKRAQNATKEIEEKVKELQEEMPDLYKAKAEKEAEHESLKREAEKVRKERQVLEEKEKKRQEAMKADLTALTAKLEKLSAKKEKFETATLPELEQQLKEVEKEIEVEEQILLKLEKEASEQNANAQSHYYQYQQYHLKQQQQRQRQQRGHHTQNLSEDHPSASSVPIQRPRHHSAELPTPTGRPIPAPIQRPSQSNLASSNLSTIWSQRPIQPQLHSQHPQTPQQPPLPIVQHTHPSFSPQLHQLHNPRSLSFHNSMTPSTNSDLIRRSSLKNPISVPFSAANFTSNGSGTRSVASSPTRSNATIVASSSTLSSKAPVFEPTRPITAAIKNLNTNASPNHNTTTNNSNLSVNTSPLLAKGKLAAPRSSTIPLPAPIQRPVRASSGDNRDRSASGSGSAQMHGQGWILSYGGGG